MANPPAHDPVPALLHQLHAVENPGAIVHAWTDATQLETVVLVSPDRCFAYAFRIPAPPFPSNAAHSAYYSCYLYVQDVSDCQTLADCLARFGIKRDHHSQWQALSPAGQPVDPATAPVQTVCVVAAP
jgi:hypothetical protein